MNCLFRFRMSAVLPLKSNKKSTLFEDYTVSSVKNWPIARYVKAIISTLSRDMA